MPRSLDFEDPKSGRFEHRNTGKTRNVKLEATTDPCSLVIGSSQLQQGASYERP